MMMEGTEDYLVLQYTGLDFMCVVSTGAFGRWICAFSAYNNFSLHMCVHTLLDIVLARHHSYMSPRHLLQSHTCTLGNTVA